MKKQVFILAGQSNMSGEGGVYWYHDRYQWDGVVPDECAPSPSFLRLSVDLYWEEARDPLHIDIELKCRTVGVGPGMSFANHLLKEISCTSLNIGLVPCAIGGTAIKEWKKGSMLYNQMVQRAKAATEIGDGGEIKAVLWYQGESDAESDHASEVYGENLKEFIENVRSDLGLPYLPFIQVALASGSKRNIDKVRNAQLGLKLPNLVCVDAMGLPLSSDHLHLTTQAQVKLGKMLAEAYIMQFLGQSKSIILFNHQLTMSQKANDLVCEIYQDDSVCGISEIYFAGATDKGDKYFNNYLSSLYQSSHGIISLVVVSSLLLYIVYIYCC